jgi:glucosamine--fructose-6-phosphate aminotransferase (isomerizing)
MTDEWIATEIDRTPAAIRATVAETQLPAQRAAEEMRRRSPRRIYLIGNGTSFYSSLAAGYTARLLARPDDPPVLPMMAGDFRHFPPPLAAGDVVVGISASGEFRDVLHIFERLKGQNLCIGISQVPGSSLTRVADITLLAGGGPSQVPVMTMTYASTLAAAHLLLLAFYQAPQTYLDDLLASADRCEASIAAAGRLIPDLIPQIVHFEHAFHFGAGCGYAAALETALKMKEMAILHAEGAETWEMASGPAVIVSAASLCVALSTGGAGDESTLQGAQHARQWGAQVLELGPQAGAGRWHVPVATPVYESFASLALVPPAALLAYRLARARGFDPNRPAWRERYLSQGMSHIIGA